VKAGYHIEGGRILFRFDPDSEDINAISKLKFDMSKIEPYVDIGDKYEIQNIHNDLIALSIILMINPFVGERLHLNFSVSEEFIKNVSSVISKYKISVKDNKINPINKNDGIRPGLAFSGGADSCAALAILPKDVCLIFMNRPLKEKTKYDSSAPLEICRRLKEVGFDVQVVDSNLEYLRIPVGFPTDLANSIPAILMSKFLEIDSVAFGTVLESAYGIGHNKYREYSKRSHYKFNSKLFNAVGLELNLPTIGISEVGTAIIGSKAPVGGIQQSCMRGKLFYPCYRCWKCFRKELLNYSLKITDNMPNFQEMMRSSEVQKKLSEYPISHENVITYSLQRIDLSEDDNLKILSSKIDLEKDLNFLNQWYSPSIDFVPDKYRFYVREQIINYLSIMRTDSEDLVTTWNMEGHINSLKAKKGQEFLLNFFNEINHN
jgi:hypothetical protein